MRVAPPGGQDRIMIYGPKTDSTYIIEFRMADGESLVIACRLERPVYLSISSEAVKPSGGDLVLANDAPPRCDPAESSARNTIETVFCFRRNHISASPSVSDARDASAAQGVIDAEAAKRRSLRLTTIINLFEKDPPISRVGNLQKIPKVPSSLSLRSGVECLSKGIIKCPTLRFSSFSLVFCSFPVRCLALRRNRSRHYALGPVFKRSGRLKRK